MIVGMGRYCRGIEVDVAQSQLIRRSGSLTPDAVSLVRAMYGRATEDPSDFLWIGVAAPTRQELVALADVFAIPKLWVDDALNPRQRAKAEFSGDGRSGLIVFKIVSYEEDTSSIETGQITMLVGASYVITVRLGPVGALGRVRAAATANPGFLGNGPLAAVHAVADAIADDYLQATEEIGRDIDVLEEAVFSTRVTDDSEQIYALKRENLELRRAVSPLVPLAHRLVSGRVPEISPELAAHFRDLGDHVLRAHDFVESYDSLLMAMLQASNGRLGLQQNTDMRKIAAYAALLALPTAVAGIYGMNFEHMPELSWRFGYPGTLTVMAVAMLVIYRAFKRSGWL